MHSSFHGNKRWKINMIKLFQPGTPGANEKCDVMCCCFGCAWLEKKKQSQWAQSQCQDLSLRAQTKDRYMLINSVFLLYNAIAYRTRTVIEVRYSEWTADQWLTWQAQGGSLFWNLPLQDLEVALCVFYICNLLWWMYSLYLLICHHDNQNKE